MTKDQIQQAKEVISKMLENLVMKGDLNKESEETIQARFYNSKDALQTALACIDENEDLKDLLLTRDNYIEELKAKLLKWEDDCIMCPHKKSLFEQ